MPKFRSVARVDLKRRELARQVREESLQSLHDELAAADIMRAFIVHENGEFRLSHHRILTRVRAFLELSNSFQAHEGIFIGRDPDLRTLFFAFVHDTRRGLAQGGLRFSRYTTVADVLDDGLRLSQGMTRKNALAGLWWGGGKGIMPLPPGVERPEQITAERGRKAYFEAFGRFVASLGGVYYTAEDVGTTTEDMNSILGQNRFTTCVATSLGGSGNPSPYTARGVLRAMQAARKFLVGSDSLEGVRVAVQGVGNVGGSLVRELHASGARIIVADPNESALERLGRELPGLRRVSPAAIFDAEADVFAPCAMGAQVNRETIPRLKVSLVCGAANNILEDPPSDAERLAARGIAYVPDFLCNRMGITNCADEWMGYLESDILLAADRVYPDTLRVLRHARTLGVSSIEAANRLADEAATAHHPLIGHRGRRLIDRLIDSGWHVGAAQASRRRSARAFEHSFDEPAVRARWESRLPSPSAERVLVAAPISASSVPTIAPLLPAILMDVHARALVAQGDLSPLRALGADHGGLELEQRVERSLPQDREETGRKSFLERCRDAYSTTNVAIRSELHGLGVEFDPLHWLDPMDAAGANCEARLFHVLLERGLVAVERGPVYLDPVARRNLVGADVHRDRLNVREKFHIAFRAMDGSSIETSSFDLELVLGGVAIAVAGSGRYGRHVGGVVRNPLTCAVMPVVAATDPNSPDAEFLVPAHNVADRDLAEHHEIRHAPEVYDGQGRVVLPDGTRASIPQARRRLVDALDGALRIEEGSWSIDVHRCLVTGNRVLPVLAEQLVLRLDEALDPLRNRIEDGTIAFQPRAWRDRVLEDLKGLQPLCISRQHWWGNAIPGRDDVFADGFSLIASTLRAAGWSTIGLAPARRELFVDKADLRTWVVPALLVSVMLTGEPCFARVHVNGTPYSVERSLVRVADGESGGHDEDIYLLESVRRPLRSSTTSQFAPAPMVARYGADAVRLGLLLCITPKSLERVVLSQTRFRGAQSVLSRFVAKVSGLEKLARKSIGSLPSVADEWLVGECTRIGENARRAYRDGALHRVGRIFGEAVKLLDCYGDLTAAHSPGGPARGAPGRALASAVATLGTWLGPACPFLFASLTERLADIGAGGPLHLEPWVPSLLNGLAEHRGAVVQVGSPQESIRDRLRVERELLEALTGARIETPAAPGLGLATITEACIIVRPGAPLSGPDRDHPVCRWYSDLHGLS